MRKLLIILSVALLLGAAGYQVLARIDGYLLLSAGPYVVETSLWGALILVILFLVSLWFLWRLWCLLILPRHWWQRIVGRKIVKDRNQTVQGILDYLDGNWPKAVENLRKGVKRSETPALNYLGAAAASFNLGDEENVNALLRQAEEHGVADVTTVGLLRTRLFLQNQQHDKALVLVEKLYRQQPGHPSVLRLLATTRRAMGDWAGLERMLADLKKHYALSSEELVVLERETYLGLISDFHQSVANNKSLSDRQAELDHLWDRLPHRLQANEILVAAYIVQLQKLGMDTRAETRLRRFLSREWSEELVEHYGKLNGDPEAQLVTAEAWLRDHSESGALLQTCGRLCVRAQLWGKAKDYFEAALRLKPSPAVWLELGELLQVLQDAKGGNECFRKGLRMVVENPEVR